MDFGREIGETAKERNQKARSNSNLRLRSATENKRTKFHDQQ